jgi:hypothetical protein
MVSIGQLILLSLLQFFGGNAAFGKHTMMVWAKETEVLRAVVFLSTRPKMVDVKGPILPVT